MVLFAEIEWIWGEAILNESFRDLYTIVGFALTLLGFAITIFQLRKTRSAAKAAETAAKKSLEESRFAFQKFTVAMAHRFVHEAKIHVDNEAWEKAAIRLSDLTDQINQLASLGDEWIALAGELHTWSVTCNRLASKELKKFPRKQKWLDLCSRLEKNLNQLLGPFADSEGGRRDLR